MRVELGPLARTGLEAQAGDDLNASIRAALLFYVHRLESGRQPTRFPDFLSTADGAEPGSKVEVEVEVDEDVAAEFEREAAAQGTTVPGLAGHAVLLYLAELDLVETRTAGAAGGSRGRGDSGL